MAELLVASAAEQEYAQALCWYADRSPIIAEDFEKAVDSAFSKILAEPLRFPVCDEQHRYYLLDRFPFQLSTAIGTKR